ncbi:hypothetical protein DFH07DRAFT_862212 [Mycena maculata]|uniref:F-box domain-containing protein n=1 Tax=Mycena maculata TaxID=230809 RepID=A0AAD7MGX2_9AGAR|nr:hypothetical protein DFH07DRAFT_862212 [Mycena maculata]
MDRLVSRLQARFSKLAVSQHAVVLPPEVWLQITPFLGASDLAPIALVSQQLRWIAQSLLFRSFIFTMRKRFSEEAFARLKSKIEFYASPRIASIVESCTIIGGHSNSPDYVVAICEGLSRFPHLKDLSFDHVRMTISTISGIARASRNRKLSLSLVSCISDFRPVQNVVVHLEEFSIHNDFHGLFPQDELWLKCLDLAVLRVLDLVQPHSTRAFMRSHLQLPALEVLDLHIAGLKGFTEDQFISSLSCFPALRALHLHPHWSTAGVWGAPAVLWPTWSRRFPPNVVPELNALSCPSNLLPAFSRDREIARLKVYDPFDMGEDEGYIKDLPSLLLEIGSHTIASFELDFVYPIDGLDAITEAFPALRSLRIVAYVPNYVLPRPDLETMITAIAGFALPPQVEVLHLTLRCTPLSPIPFWGAPGDDDRVGTALHDLGHQWPSLRGINLSREVYNRDGQVEKVVMISWPGLSINRTAKSRDPWELDNITVAADPGKVPHTAWCEATRMHGFRCPASVG